MSLSIVEKVFAGLDSAYRSGYLDIEDLRVKPNENKEEGVMSPVSKDEGDDTDYMEIPEQAQVARQMLNSPWQLALNSLDVDAILAEEDE